MRNSDIVGVGLMIYAAGFFSGVLIYESDKPEAIKVTIADAIEHECVTKQEPRLSLETEQAQRVLVPIESVMDLVSTRVTKLEAEIEALSHQLSQNYTSDLRNAWVESLDYKSRNDEEQGIIYNALLSVLDIYPTPSQSDAIIVLYDTFMRNHEDMATHQCNHNCTLRKWSYKAELIKLQGTEEWLAEDHRAISITRRQKASSYPQDKELDWFRSLDFWATHFEIPIPEEFQL
jgi:hypothetical protein